MVEIFCYAVHVNLALEQIPNSLELQPRGRKRPRNGCRVL